MQRMKTLPTVLFCLSAVLTSVSTQSICRHCDEGKWPFKKTYITPVTQSPTDIITKDVKICSNLPVLELHQYLTVPDEAAIIVNTGTYLEVFVRKTSERGNPYLVGGPLANSTYELFQLHFHWGFEDCCGSEHYLDGRRFAVESHIVFVNKAYGDIMEAQKHVDGVAVIALFGELSETDNPDLEHLVSLIPKVRETNATTPGSFWQDFKFTDIMFGQNTYYTYPGSLTTLPFEECVTFIVFPHPFRISSNQIRPFRTLLNRTEPIENNARELQPFNNRPLVEPFIKPNFIVKS